MRRAAAAGATVLPVDSEHNALFQALAAGDAAKYGASSSPRPAVRFGPGRARRSRATPEQALRHPELVDGAEITIDSATMMNKGLELIEAHHLFALPADQIDVLVHPQSVVHGLVEFRDGSVVGQLGAPDMRIPIAHCLAWPQRMSVPTPRLDLAKIGSLTFEEPDLDAFPRLSAGAASARDGRRGADGA